MGKSTRSKWKKMHKRQRAADEAGNVAARVDKLNNKLDLVVQGGLSNVPMEDPETRFHFAAPAAEVRKPGERLKLAPLKSNPYGKSDPTAPHPQTVTFDTVDKAAPVAGCAISVEDVKRMQNATAASFQQAFQAAMKRATVQSGQDDDDDAPVEITIGCNDDENINDATFAAAKPKKGSAVVKKVSGGGALAATTKKGSKKEVAEAPKRITSMALRKNETAGDSKMKGDTKRTRLVSGTTNKSKK